MTQGTMWDEAFLAQKAEPAVLEGLPVAHDHLLGTLTIHKEDCVGMAANLKGRSLAFLRRR